MSEQSTSLADDSAKKRANAVIGFKVHLIVYLAVNALLLAINVALFDKTAKLASGETVNLPFIVYFWVMWPIWGWGLGLLIHYVVIREAGRMPADWWSAAKPDAAAEADRPRA